MAHHHFYWNNYFKKCWCNVSEHNCLRTFKHIHGTQRDMHTGYAHICTYKKKVQFHLSRPWRFMGSYTTHTFKFGIIFLPPNGFLKCQISTLCSFDLARAHAYVIFEQWKVRICKTVLYKKIPTRYTTCKYIYKFNYPAWPSSSSFLNSCFGMGVLYM